MANDLIEGKSAEHVVAMLLAAGKYNVPEIARCTGLRNSEVYALRESADFQELVTHYAERFTEKELEEVRSLLNRDAPANFEFLRSVRDGDFMGISPQQLSLRVRAAETLFDKQVEKKAAADTSNRVVVNLTADAVRAIKQALTEDDGPVIDVEAIE
jgi:hypothetical protein